MSFITPDDSKIFIKKEIVLRNGDVAITPTDLFAFDLIDGGFTIPEPYRAREEFHKLGGGRNVAQIADLGYETPEDSLDLRWMAGTFLYYAMGACDTSGTSVTERTATGGTASVSLEFVTAVTADVLDGMMVEFTASGAKFQIVEVGTNTLIVSVPMTTTDIGTATFTVTGPPYTHIISESNSLPSFSMHVEQGEGDTKLVRDLLGCVVSGASLSIEKDAIGKISVDVLTLASVTGNALTTTEIPTDLTDEIYNWTMINQTDAVTYIDYNGAPVDTTKIATQIDTYSISVKSDNEATKVMGDEYGKIVKVGKREYDLSVHIYPQKQTLYNLRNTKIKDYVSVLTSQIKLTRATDDTVNWNINSLYLSVYPNALPSWEDKIVGLDAEFRLNEGGSSTITITDAKSIKYYERVQHA